MTEELHRDFKGIWIPKSIWLNDGLNITEKAFLAEIDSLSNNDQGCFASNNHFKKFSKLSRTRCSEIIRSLNEKGFISIRYIREGEQIKKRIIKVVEIPKGGSRETEAPSRDSEGGSRESLKRENQYRNTISNTKRERKKASEDKTLSFRTEIIDYMNEIYGTKFSPKTKQTKEFMNARLKEGFTKEDFKLAVAGQWLNWKDNKKMRQHLVPKTIFRASNFEGYVEDAKRRKDIRQDLAIAQQDQLHEEEMPF